jgi:hypothetical protein
VKKRVNVNGVLTLETPFDAFLGYHRILAHFLDIAATVVFLLQIQFSVTLCTVLEE